MVTLTEKEEEEEEEEAEEEEEEEGVSEEVGCVSWGHCGVCFTRLLHKSVGFESLLAQSTPVVHVLYTCCWVDPISASSIW